MVGRWAWTVGVGRRDTTIFDLLSFFPLLSIITVLERSEFEFRFSIQKRKASDSLCEINSEYSKSKYKEVTSRTALSLHNDSSRLSGRWALRFSPDPYLPQKSFMKGYSTHYDT